MQRIRMWVRKWLRYWVPAKIPFKEKLVEEEMWEPLYEREMKTLVSFLGDMEGKEVCHSYIDGGYTARVYFEKSNETIALVKPFPKGERKSQIFIKVEIETAHDRLKICFQVAFLGFKLTFSRPVLQLHRQQIEHPRGP